MSTNPELGRRIVAGGLDTNYHDVGDGPPVLLIHGSGPGVTAYANWRLTMPALAEQFRVIAPDMAGFGETERPRDYVYSMDHWVDHAVGLLDALGVERAHVIGNSFGGALALALAIRAPERVGRLVLMGAAGTRFTLTEGLDAVWGYTPSIANMRGLLDIFAFDRTLVNDELAKLRYDASVRPGYQEAFANMFPVPRQRWVDALASDEVKLRALPHDTLIVHGREDRVIPLDSSMRLLELLPNAQLHVFGNCGHWTQIEHAARFNRLVIDHFSESTD
ncbi:alpha/beta fold hydrolase [Burkholderia diffusa]|uniref:2-hydroxy-6-oxo-2,4-heptadienoate hydrolase n=1 Tax=Burkholderia diffusa TaxID=488732 RepID=A0A6P2N2I4_9BURK|nr:alpha/beta fold hydrolase [Burkholderia diffusa]KAB0662907.1 alpha/beta fold hydrolase [Burkholderia diffusa]MBM2652621.1 alpha/beta fold hydrolase [Burkholderia diffusa]VWB89187.1 2-hydroxy-6-oxo-2,4-heptadienoate hydrolase [Burkholderia diffusa]